MIESEFQTRLLQMVQQTFRLNFSRNQILSFSEITREICLQTGLEETAITNHLSQARTWYQDVCELQYLDEILKMPFEEVIFHSYPRIQIIPSVPKTEEVALKLPYEDFLISLEILGLRHGVEWNYKNPFISFHLPHQGKRLRIGLVHPSMTQNHEAKLFIRSLSNTCFPLDAYHSNNEIPEFFQELIHSKKNILIAGATGSGKTSFMKSLSSLIPEEEHIMTLEDTPELFLTQPYLTSLISQESTGSKSLASYCTYSMRLRPDRILLGEIRSHEVIPFLMALNSGHRGLMSTIHANNAQDAIRRMALLFTLYSENSQLNYEIILQLLTSNIDYVVYLEGKKVVEIIKVIGHADGKIVHERIIGIETETFAA